MALCLSPSVGLCRCFHEVPSKVFDSCLRERPFPLLRAYQRKLSSDMNIMIRKTEASALKV